MIEQVLTNTYSLKTNLVGQKAHNDYVAIKLQLLIDLVNSIEKLFFLYDKKFDNFERMRIHSFMQYYHETKNKDGLLNKINHFLKARDLRRVDVRDLILDSVLDWCGV
jgi:hypothetical protein